MGSQIMQIMKKVRFANDKAHLMSLVNEISFLRDFDDDDEIVDVLCVIISMTENLEVKYYALDTLLKFKGR